MSIKHSRDHIIIDTEPAKAIYVEVVLGASIPIILTSRSNSIFSRIASTDLAMQLTDPS